MRGLILTGLLASHYATYAQGSKPVLKYMPLAMLDPFQYTLHGGLEVPFSANESIQIEGGWVFGYLGQSAESDFRQRGFKVRSQYRTYFSLRAPKDHPAYALQGGYVALMGSYQRYTQEFEYQDTVGFYRLSTRYIQAYEISFLVGYQTQLGNRLTFDVWGGLGGRYAVHSWEPKRPVTGFPSIRVLGDLFLLPGGRPVPRMGLALGWILR